MKEQHEQLIQAMVKNDAFRVKALLHEEPGLVRAKDTQGRTPILFCLYFGHVDLASLVRELTPEPDLFEVAALGEVDLLKDHLTRSTENANAVAPDGFGVLGLATFFGALSDPALGVAIAVAIAIHNIPEGVSVSVPIYFEWMF